MTGSPGFIAIASSFLFFFLISFYLDFLFAFFSFFLFSFLFLFSFPLSFLFLSPFFLFLSSLLPFFLAFLFILFLPRCNPLLCCFLSNGVKALKRLPPSLFLSSPLPSLSFPPYPLPLRTRENKGLGSATSGVPSSPSRERETWHRRDHSTDQFSTPANWLFPINEPVCRHVPDTVLTAWGCISGGGERAGEGEGGTRMVGMERDGREGRGGKGGLEW